MTSDWAAQILVIGAAAVVVVFFAEFAQHRAAFMAGSRVFRRNAVIWRTSATGDAYARGWPDQAV